MIRSLFTLIINRWMDDADDRIHSKRFQDNKRVIVREDIDNNNLSYSNDGGKR